MPVHFLADWVSSHIPSEYYASIAAALVATSFLKTWSAGPKLLEIEEQHDASPSPSPSSSPSSSPSPSRDANGDFASTTLPALRDLHGRVVLVASGAFSPVGLVTLSSLAHRGAQIIALTPTLRSPRILQLVALLRSSTNNQLIYAEQCNLSDLSSVSSFAAKWNQGDTATAGPSGGGKGGARRLDILLFLPSEESVYSIGHGVKPSRHHPRYERAYVDEVLSRFHLVNSLLPSLLLLPPDRDIRIVSAISPWYAAGARSFDAITEDPASKSYQLSTAEPWRIHGATSLRWYALMRELQRRLHLLAEADTSPRDKLPGINPEATVPVGIGAKQQQGQEGGLHKRKSNISTICISTGFERNADVLAFLTPPNDVNEIDLYAVDNEDDEDEDEARTTKQKDNNDDNDDATTKLKAAIDPRRLASDRSSRATRTTASLRTLHSLPSSTSSTTFSSTLSTLPSLLTRILCYMLLTLLWPFIWLMTQSPATSSNSYIWAMTKRLESDMDYLYRLSSPSRLHVEIQNDTISTKEKKRRIVRLPLRGGEVYRAGRIVRPTIPLWLLEEEEQGRGFARLWKDEEKKVEMLLGRAKRPGRDEGVDEKRWCKVARGR